MRGACSNACKLLGRNCDSSRLSTTTATRPILGTSANCFTKIFVRIYEDILLLDREIRVFKIAGYFFFFLLQKESELYKRSRYTRGRNNRGNYGSCWNNERDHSGYECLMRVNCDAIVIRIDWNNRCSSLLQTFTKFTNLLCKLLRYIIIKI